MEFTGKVEGVVKNWSTNQYQITFSVNEESAIEQIDNIMKCDKLSIKATKYRKKRSLDANGLLWLCLGRIASNLRTDKWDVYLEMLKRYGQYTYIVVKEKVVEQVKQQWRECEVVGEIEVNGQKAIQMLCYFGSSTYNSKEFSVLLDGVISEMQEMGLETPTSSELKRVMEQYENSITKK